MMVKDYDTCTDEELIARLRAGEREITDYLIDKYKSLVRTRARALYLVGGDHEDLIQEGMLGLFKAVRDYKPGKEASFATFAGLCIDRVGMSLAFAGLLGLAAADRISARAGVALAALVAVAAPATALVAWLGGNMTPWAVLQGGGLVLLAALALRRPQPRALGFSIIGVIAFYAVAKALELADAPVFALTQQLISGHSAKHLVAALAAWPVVRALQSLARGAPAGHAARTIR